MFKSVWLTVLRTIRPHPSLPPNGEGIVFSPIWEEIQRGAYAGTSNHRHRLSPLLHEHANLLAAVFYIDFKVGECIYQILKVLSFDFRYVHIDAMLG